MVAATNACFSIRLIYQFFFHYSLYSPLPTYPPPILNSAYLTWLNIHTCVFFYYTHCKVFCLFILDYIIKLRYIISFVQLMFSSRWLDDSQLQPQRWQKKNP